MRLRAGTLPLNRQQVEDFRKIVQEIVDLEEEYEFHDDNESSLDLSKQLRDCGVSSQHFLIFSQLIQSAEDA